MNSLPDINCGPLHSVEAHSARRVLAMGRGTPPDWHTARRGFAIGRHFNELLFSTKVRRMHLGVQMINAVCELGSGSHPKWKQGDPQLYTRDNVAARLTLRRDPLVGTALQKWWAVMQNTFGTPDAPATFLVEHQFVTILCKLGKALLNDVDYDRAEVLEAAQADWEMDSCAQVQMTREMFMDSLFELCDIWTDGISALEYHDFLMGLLWRVAGGNPPSLLDDSLISYGGFRARDEDPYGEQARLAELERELAERELERRAAEWLRQKAEDEARRAAEEAERLRLEMEAFAAQQAALAALAAQQAALAAQQAAQEAAKRAAREAKAAKLEAAKLSGMSAAERAAYLEGCHAEKMIQQLEAQGREIRVVLLQIEPPWLAVRPVGASGGAVSAYGSSNGEPSIWALELRQIDGPELLAAREKAAAARLRAEEERLERERLAEEAARRAAEEAARRRAAEEAARLRKEAEEEARRLADIEAKRAAQEAFKKSGGRMGGGLGQSFMNPRGEIVPAPGRSGSPGGSPRGPSASELPKHLSSSAGSHSDQLKALDRRGRPTTADAYRAGSAEGGGASAADGNSSSRAAGGDRVGGGRGERSSRGRNPQTQRQDAAAATGTVPTASSCTSTVPPSQPSSSARHPSPDSREPSPPRQRSPPRQPHSEPPTSPSNEISVDEISPDEHNGSRAPRAAADAPTPIASHGGGGRPGRPGLQHSASPSSVGSLAVASERKHTKWCPQCTFDNPPDAAVCGLCGYDYAAAAEALKSKRYPWSQEVALAEEAEEVAEGAQTRRPVGREAAATAPVHRSGGLQVGRVVAVFRREASAAESSPASPYTHASGDGHVKGGLFPFARDIWSAEDARAISRQATPLPGPRSCIDYIDSRAEAMAVTPGLGLGAGFHPTFPSRCPTANGRARPFTPRGGSPRSGNFRGACAAIPPLPPCWSSPPSRGSPPYRSLLSRPASRPSAQLTHQQTPPRPSIAPSNSPTCPDSPACSPVHSAGSSSWQFTSGRLPPRPADGTVHLLRSISTPEMTSRTPEMTSPIGPWAARPRGLGNELHSRGRLVRGAAERGSGFIVMMKAGVRLQAVGATASPPAVKPLFKQ